MQTTGSTFPQALREASFALTGKSCCLQARDALKRAPPSLVDEIELRILQYLEQVGSCCGSARVEGW